MYACIARGVKSVARTGAAQIANPVVKSKKPVDCPFVQLSVREFNVFVWGFVYVIWRELAQPLGALDFTYLPYYTPL